MADAHKHRCPLRAGPLPFSAFNQLPKPAAGTLTLDTTMRRRIKGEPVNLSTRQTLSAVVAFDPLWRIAELIETSLRTEHRVGRPREHGTFEVLLVEMAAWLTGSVRAAIRELADPDLWQSLHEAAQHAWADHTHRRLDDTTISRSQYLRFRQHHLLPRSDDITLACIQAAIDTAQTCGMLDETRGSATHRSLIRQNVDLGCTQLNR